ncbi:hypothetical protein ACFPIJ_61115 [Dactylosporangium cerinum]|uniref:Uncharacterized protein n=1 Tax=Dactylosporangium cerinum TaxID=1434730 RepID=A0ABV9WI86_9ACTN
MGTDVGTGEHDDWQPRSRVGAVVAALLVGDQDAAEQVAAEPQDEPEQAADEPQDDKEPLVLAAAIRLAVRSLFDEDTPAEAIAEDVALMARDVEVDQEAAVAVIRAHLGPDDALERLLTPFPPQVVIDTTWTVFGYLCEQRLGREDSLELIAQAERETLEPERESLGGGA